MVEISQNAKVSEDGIVTRLCQNCHKPFSYKSGRGKHAKYCSPECKTKFYRPYYRDTMRRKRNGTFVYKEKIKPVSLRCAICGKKFQVIPSRREKAKYCSRECFYKSLEKKILTNCGYCGEKIRVPPNRLARSKQVFCSWRCKKKAEVKQTLRVCIVCNKTFRSKNQVYCSRQCMTIGYNCNIQLKCEVCGKTFSVSPSLKNRRFCSVKCFNIYLSRKMKQEYRTGKRTIPLCINQFRTGKRSDLGNQFFRSSWEANIARFLDYYGIEWIYEPQRFNLGNTTYLPDFYLPVTSYFLEVKGYYRNTEWKEKIRLFRENHHIVVIDKKVYYQLQILFSHLIANWEFS